VRPAARRYIGRKKAHGLSRCKMSSVRFTAGTAAPPSFAAPVAPIHEPWFKHRLQWALSLPQGVHVIISTMAAWACLGVGCGAIALAAEPHGPALTCALALLLGAIYAWAALFGAIWVEDELGMRATAPLFLLLTTVAVLMATILTGTPRVWLAVLAGLQCVCLMVAFSPFASTQHKRDFGWRGLRRVGASSCSKYGDWWLALRSRLQAPLYPRATRPVSRLHASHCLPRIACLDARATSFVRSWTSSASFSWLRALARFRAICSMWDSRSASSCSA